MFIIIIACIIGLIIAIPAMFCIGYLAYLIIQSFTFHSMLYVKKINPFIEETVEDIPTYEPAIMGYLVNYQKIGRREICSTLFDLIAKDAIKLDLKKGFVTDNLGEYELKRNDENKQLKVFEKELIVYLFDEKDTINQNDLKEKLYKNNLNNDFYKSFLRNVQNNCKKYNFFSEKAAKYKETMYKVVNKVTTIIASVSSFFFALSFEIIDSIDGDFEFAITIILGLLVTAALLWVIKFLITYFYNVTCYYNSFSKRGNDEYRKWQGFKKYLKKWSSMPTQPIMSVTIWQRYYAYSIGLKVSKKFFKQMKKMKVVDNSIDIAMFETFNFMVSNIGTSVKKMKSISIDRFGGSHIDY